MTIVSAERLARVLVEIADTLVDEFDLVDVLHMLVTRTARPVVHTDFGGGGTPWPRFAPHAAAAGYRTVHAFPLRLRREVIGALNVFGITVP